MTAFEKIHRGRLGKCWVNVSCSTAFAHRVDDQRGVSMVSSAHFPSDPSVLYLGMCLLMVGCDSLLGRFNREFLVAKPSMFRIARVRSRAAAASALPVRRRRLGQEMEIVLGDPGIEERTFTSILEFFRQCKILAHTWAVCGAFKVTFAGKEVYFCHWGEVTAYFTSLEDRVLGLTTAYQEHSVVNWVTKVEELFRARAIELTSGPEDKVPWCKALLLASQELSERWNQHKDILVLNQGSVLQHPKALALKDKDVTTKGSKSKSKGSTGKGKNNQVKQEVYETDRSIFLRDRPGEHTDERRKWVAMGKWQGKELCRAWNDGNGCDYWYPAGREHRCDTKLRKTRAACGAKDHCRMSHDPKLHGEPEYR